MDAGVKASILVGLLRKDFEKQMQELGKQDLIESLINEQYLDTFVPLGCGEEIVGFWYVEAYSYSPSTLLPDYAKCIGTLQKMFKEFTNLEAKVWLVVI